jgi:hypothetical protein
MPFEGCGISKPAAVAIVIFLLVLVSLFIMENYAPPTPVPANTAIMLVGAGYSSQKDMATSTTIYNVTATFENHGAKTYTFFGSISLADKNNNNLGFEGQTMTLIPGQDQTINETFTTNISPEQYVRVVYKIT